MIFVGPRGLPQGERENPKNLDFLPCPMASIGKSKTLRFSLNSASVFGELFSEIVFSKNLVQFRSKLYAFGDFSLRPVARTIASASAGEIL